MTSENSRFRKRIAVLSVVCMIATMVPVSAFGAEASDISSHWAKSEIQSWIDDGLINGYQDGTFRPENNITRAEFMALVNNAFEFTDKAAVSYSDVASTAWYAEVIAKAKAAGYITGYADNTMKPDFPITRAEAAAIITKIDYLQISGLETAGFTDAAALTWSKDAVVAVSLADIMNGYTDGSFRPQNNIKRGEAVVALGKALSYNENNTVYNATGTYGPESGTLAVDGNVTVVEKGTVLQNMTISGDLIISRNIGEGDVTLKNVTVKGETFVYGGGQNSIIVIDSTLGNVTVTKENGKIRIVVSGNTTVGQVLATSGVKLEEGTLTGGAEGFREIILDASDDDTIVLVGKFTEVNVAVPGLNIEVPEGTTVDKLVFDEAASVTGSGTINAATINASGVTFENAPKTTSVATGVTAPKVGDTTTETSSSSGGSSHHNSSVAVTAVTVTGTSNAAIVANGGTLQMIATITPSTATDQTVVWSVTNGTGEATINTNGLLTETAAGTVTVKATNTASGIFGIKEVHITSVLGISEAPMVDQDDPTADITPADYAVSESNGTISITASDVPAHENGAGTIGYWVGTAIEIDTAIVDNAKVYFGTSAYVDQGLTDIDTFDAIAGEDGDYLCFYANAGAETPKTHIYIELYNSDDQLLETLTYTLNLNGVTIEE